MKRGRKQKLDPRVANGLGLVAWFADPNSDDVLRHRELKIALTALEACSFIWPNGATTVLTTTTVEGARLINIRSENRSHE